MEMNEDILSYIFANMEDSICMTGTKGEVIFMNNAAEKLFDCHGAWKNKKLSEIIPIVERNDPLIQLFIDALQEKRKSFHALVDYENAAGNVARLHVSITCVWEEIQYFLIVISDLTQLTKVNSAFERYTSPEIADYVLNTEEGSREGGFRKEVSILMSDLRGFTAISSRMSSDHLIQMVNSYFEFMTEVIEKHRGTIIEFLGDGLFVVFGAPNSLPHHAEEAVACAIEMQNAMKPVNEWNRKKGFPDLEMGIGINTGFATVGNIGSEKKMKFGCVGEVVNLAGRTESLTTGGQIYITEYTLAQMSEKPDIREVRSLQPKGAKTPLELFRISGLGSKYQLEEVEKELLWTDLPAGIPFRFQLLNEKIVAESGYSATLCKLSEDEKYGWIKADCSLKELQNLAMDTGEKTYAKVIKQESGGYRICFTSKPESFSEWLHTMLIAAQSSQSTTA